jgi:hypothetical protein
MCAGGYEIMGQRLQWSMGMFVWELVNGST